MWVGDFLRTFIHSCNFSIAAVKLSLQTVNLFLLILFFFSALLRQTNPLWVAYFFVTDINPFDERLLEILSKYQDPRLVYTPIPQKYKIKVKCPRSLFIVWVNWESLPTFSIYHIFGNFTFSVLFLFRHSSPPRTPATPPRTTSCAKWWNAPNAAGSAPLTLTMCMAARWCKRCWMWSPWR